MKGVEQNISWNDTRPLCGSAPLFNNPDLSLIWTAGEQENVEKFSKRLVKVTKQHNEECKQLLTLMGVPYIEVSLFPAYIYN